MQYNTTGPQARSKRLILADVFCDSDTMDMRQLVLGVVSRKPGVVQLNYKLEIYSIIKQHWSSDFDFNLNIKTIWVPFPGKRLSTRCRNHCGAQVDATVPLPPGLL